MRRGWIALFVVAHPACGEPERYDMIDSIGVRFAIEPHESGGFVFHEPKEEPLPCSEELGTPMWGLGFGWMFELCSGCEDENGIGWGFSPSWCRPAVCDRDDQCAPIGDDVYTCVNGLCQNLDRAQDPISEFDAGLLCRADAPRHVIDSPPEVTARFAQLHCDDETRTCALPLPDGCLQP